MASWPYKIHEWFSIVFIEKKIDKVFAKSANCIIPRS